VTVGVGDADQGGTSMYHLGVHTPEPLPETVYIRTTPGHLLLNHLIYENLFL
jgi:hypothetical protein